MPLQMVALTDRGCVRKRNEDVVYVEPQTGLVILADGMGGHRSGDVASRLAVDVAAQKLQAGTVDPDESSDTDLQNHLIAAFAEANRQVYELSKNTPEHSGMGTTMTLALYGKHHFCLGHVGDSRLYKLRDDQLSQITEDHTYEAQLSRMGQLDDSLRGPLGKMLVRAVGIDEEIDVDTEVRAYVSGDLFMLCSDGLTDMLDDVEIERILREHDGLESRAEQLIRNAKAKGGPDNISIILVAG